MIASVTGREFLDQESRVLAKTLYPWAEEIELRVQGGRVAGVHKADRP